MRVKIKRLLFYLLLIPFLFCTLNSLSQSAYQAEGRVIDFDTRQPLKGVSVIIRESKRGTVTNDSGYFNIIVPNREFTLNFSAVGYVRYHTRVDLSENTKPLLIEFKRKADEQLEEVIVNANVNTTKVNAVEMNTIRLSPELIKRTPLLLGEADIIKALILQPGVTTVGEGAGGFNVRGGNADQNLVLIDGAPLFNTSHLLGFYTSVSPDAIQEVTLYKGGMPAQYGGRLSSLLNIKTKTGNDQRMQYSGGVSPMTARFNINGPLIKNKLHITGGFRIAYPNVILSQLSGEFGDSRALFYDGIAKAEYSFNPNNQVSITGYRSYDEFRFDSQTEYDWLSNLASLNYTSNLNSKFSLKLNANYSHFQSGINNYEKYYEYKLHSSITHKEVKASIVFTPGDKQKIELGVNGILYRISPGTQNPTADSSTIMSTLIQREHGRELAVYVTDEINFTDNISLQLGLRYASYSYLGPKNIYQYEAGVPMSKETISDTITFSKNKNIQEYAGLEPRVSLRIKLNDALSVKVSYNRGQQFLHLISNTTAISPVDFWKLSDKYNKGQVGDQYAAGIFKTFNNNQYLLSFEGYYKSIENVIQYKDGARLLLNPFIETSLLNSRGRAYGLETSFSKNIGKFTGQVNYTYSRAEVQIVTKFAQEIVNDGNWYPSDHDRPHNLAIITRLGLGRGWSFNNNFVFITGKAVSFPDGNYAYNGTLVNNYSKRNMDRLPAYHRLDIGFSYISKRVPEQRKYSVWNFSFYNVYMRKNAYSIFFKRNRDDIFFARPHDTLIPYQLSVAGSIIPSISWNFYF
jgi:hypothetical protein